MDAAFVELRFLVQRKLSRLNSPNITLVCGMRATHRALDFYFNFAAAYNCHPHDAWPIFSGRVSLSRHTRA